MKFSLHIKARQRRFMTRFGVVTAGILCLGSLAVSSALASFEQVGNFAGTPGALESQSIHTEWPESVQLNGLSGMAVNYTGAGGVPAGDVYAAALDDGSTRVARYNPDGSFSEAWLDNAEGGEPTVRCGPEGEPLQPHCKTPASQARSTGGVAVDEATGDVYVFSLGGFTAKKMDIQVYSPDGSKLISEFGEQAPNGETIAESPERLHQSFSSFNGGIAVNSAGEVYVYDLIKTVAEERSRIMVFEPRSPGDYEHYVYAGESHDLTVPNSQIEHVAMDAAGDLFAGDTHHVWELNPGSPGSAPLCEFALPAGGIASMTVNPADGEVFFDSFKDYKVHQLHSCRGGVFVEGGMTGTVSPLRREVSGMAFDPVRRFAPGRPQGVLYAGSPTSEGGKEEVNAEHETFTESSLGFVFAPPVEAFPEVADELVSNVTASSAVLGASIGPESSATRFVFEYESQEAFEANNVGDRFTGASIVPLGGGFVGEGKSVVSVSSALSGLVSGMSYRYRVVATSHCSSEDPEKECETVGGALSFRTLGSRTPGVLPDGRVYELVSPPAKNGGQVFPADPYVTSCEGCKPGIHETRFPLQSDGAGDAVAFEGAPFSSDGGSVNANEYVARRDPVNGWQTVDLTPALLESRGSLGGYDAFGAGLDRGVLFQAEVPLSGEAPGEYDNLYMQSSMEPFGLTPLLKNGPPDRPATGSGAFVMRYAGASADMSRVFFEANDALTEEVPGVAPAAVDGGAAKFNLYEWREGGLFLVNVLPGNTVTQPGASFGRLDAQAISSDGSRVFFSDEAGQVYVREDGDNTREIQTEGTPDPGRFVQAATDGSAVLLENGHLHYLGDEESTVDLTQGKGGFLGLVAASEDLSHVYFVDSKVLTGGEENEHCEENAGCEKAVEGGDNLYAWRQTGGTRFVGTLAAADDAEADVSGGGVISDWAASPARRTAQASPDGRYLAFMSMVPFTGYDTKNMCVRYNEGTPSFYACSEAFLYDSSTGKLTCPSCNRTGERPLGFSTLRRFDSPGVDLPLPRYLTDQGRLFFDSQDSLVAGDTNAGIEDVYEYEPNDVGSCQEAEGCVSLISRGTGLYDSNFVTTDNAGEDVFFTTVDRLSWRDKDELSDLYDARVEGDLPIEEQTENAECSGETCQRPATTSVLSTPASLTFEGAGNITPTPASIVKPKSGKPAHKPKPKKKKRKKGKAGRGGHAAHTKHHGDDKGKTRKHGSAK